jgi:hypothetical protein
MGRDDYSVDLDTRYRSPLYMSLQVLAEASVRNSEDSTVLIKIGRWLHIHDSSGANKKENKTTCFSCLGFIVQTNCKRWICLREFMPSVSFQPSWQSLLR